MLRLMGAQVKHALQACNTLGKLWRYGAGEIFCF